MRRPPRKKDEDLITRRVIGRVIFSASVIVFATLFVYATALSDSMMSHRDQTMVSNSETPPIRFSHSFTPPYADLHMLRVP